jgi:RluA family pseudouridine synthase
MSPDQCAASIPVLFEDDEVMVFNKSANLLVTPAPGKPGRTLTSIVNEQYAACGGKKLYPCHRLDLETSGAIIFAKGKAAQKKMMDLFHRNQVEKAYVAFVFGSLGADQGELRSRTVNLERRQGRRYSPSREAALAYEVIRRCRQFSVVRVRPRTGRTNQIRIQFSQIGHPLVGERKYAVGKNHPLRFRRAALHAEELRWVHPETRRPVHVKAELPGDMTDFLVENK